MTLWGWELLTAFLTGFWNATGLPGGILRWILNNMPKEQKKSRDSATQWPHRPLRR